MPRTRRPLAVIAILVVGTLLVACAGAPAGPTAGAASAAGEASATAAAAPAALPAEVDVAAAASLIEGGAFLLDVREPSEFAAGHVEGATLVPLGDLSGRLAEVPRDRQVVVMCRTGHRSAQGRDLLLRAGYPSVTSMAGGIAAWTASGRAVVGGG